MQILGKSGTNVLFFLQKETGVKSITSDETMVYGNPSLVSCGQQISFDAQLKPASGNRADPSARPVI